MKKLIPILIGLLTIGSLGFAVTIDELKTDTGDTYIAEYYYYNNCNYGSRTYMPLTDSEVTRYDWRTRTYVQTPMDYHGLIKFDISSISGNVDTSNLCMYMSANNLKSTETVCYYTYINGVRTKKCYDKYLGPMGFKVSTHKIDSSEIWDENTVTWNNKPSYNSVAEDTLQFTDTSPLDWYCWDITEGLKESLSNGDSEIGIYFKAFDGFGKIKTTYNTIAFQTKETPYIFEPDYRPKIEVTYL